MGSVGCFVYIIEAFNVLLVENYESQTQNVFQRLFGNNWNRIFPVRALYAWICNRFPKTKEYYKD